ncbi:MAG: hypothetical protein LBP98_08595 [Tannerella sp.]|jgi:hypothetical protein|nr:hypothetical protein [Tannerella sp.]
MTKGYAKFIAPQKKNELKTTTFARQMNDDHLKRLRTKRTQKPKSAFLYSGLGVLLVAFASKWTGAAVCYFWLLLGAAVVLKTLFLISVFRAREFKPSLWFHLILTGVSLILLSQLFKTIFPVPVLYKILFYSAITLKATGLILMLCSKRKG